MVSVASCCFRALLLLVPCVLSRWPTALPGGGLDGEVWLGRGELGAKPFAAPLLL